MRSQRQLNTQCRLNSVLPISYIGLINLNLTQWFSIVNLVEKYYRKSIECTYDSKILYKQPIVLNRIVIIDFVTYRFKHLMPALYLNDV
jgi:hypothetical protein